MQRKQANPLAHLLASLHHGHQEAGAQPNHPASKAPNSAQDHGGHNDILAGIKEPHNSVPHGPRGASYPTGGSYPMGGGYPMGPMHEVAPMHGHLPGLHHSESDGHAAHSGINEALEHLMGGHHEQHESPEHETEEHEEKKEAAMKMAFDLGRQLARQEFYGR